ncbi:hypothetical protein B9Z19DRAFT_1065390 [Tuber borchii]|uniref:Uncharacterized protein n=1 Tax=Tuber borchii TaxID=42251 RepID=A0A2T6ZR94_TUBBO|nr:hypothetical protein B9Z19DRAFT_1065390 [Tuber borchii]
MTLEKSAKARGLMGRLLDSNHRELYATEWDPAKLWKKLESSASETQSEKDKLYVLLSHLPLQYHPFHTAISNNPNFKDSTYDDICDLLILEHQQLIGDAGYWAKDCPKKAPSSASLANEGRGKVISAWMAATKEEIGRTLDTRLWSYTSYELYAGAFWML